MRKTTLVLGLTAGGLVIGSQFLPDTTSQPPQANRLEKKVETTATSTVPFQAATSLDNFVDENYEPGRATTEIPTESLSPERTWTVTEHKPAKHAKTFEDMSAYNAKVAEMSAFGFDALVGAELYQQEWTVTDLERLEGHFETMAKYILPEIPMDKNAQVSHAKAIDSYDKSFVDNPVNQEMYKATTGRDLTLESLRLELPALNPGLFETFRRGRRATTGTWFRSGASGAEQSKIDEITNYLFNNEASFMRAFEKAVAEAQAEYNK